MTAIPATWTPLISGVYYDNVGGLHLVVAEMLTAAGYADTAANRETLVEAAREVFPGAVLADDEAETR